MASKFTARYDGVCIQCGEQIVGHQATGDGQGQAIHWSRGPSANKGTISHCSKGCCNCLDPVGLDLRDPGLKDAEVRPSRGSAGDDDEGQDAAGDGDPRGGDGGQSNDPAWDFDPGDLNASQLAQALEMVQQKAKSEAEAEAQEQLRQALKAQQDNAGAEEAENLRQELEEARQELEEASKTKRIEVVRPDGSTVDSDDLEHTHDNFERLLKLVAADLLVCMVGKPGGGKSYSAGQLATALGVPYRGHISLHPLSSPSEVLGMRYADGTYYATVFRAAFEHGGVVMLDEIFNSSPQMQARINSMLASGQGDFPDSMIQRHPDCYIVAADNTYGLGGDWMFPERRAADAAFRNRWTFIDWPYDEPLEQKLALALHPECGAWVRWIRDVRRYVEDNQIPLVVSPRSTMDGAKIMALTDLEIDEIAEVVLFKGADQATVDVIVNDLGGYPDRPAALPEAAGKEVH